jgi:hypothetical protein
MPKIEEIYIYFMPKVMYIYEAAELQLIAFLTAARTSGNESSASLPGRFIPGR